MKTNKTTIRSYAAWNFDREIADLNKESEAGWQLTKGACFHSRFRYDPSVVYRYALDYNTDIDDPMQYREIFREQGWEYISSTFNGWHYFRKAYDPFLPEEAYTIYTDRTSDGEMKKRWTRLAYATGTAMALVFLAGLAFCIWRPELSLFFHTLCFLAMSLAFFLGGRKIKQASQKGSTAKRRGMSFIIVLFAMLIVGLVFSTAKLRLQTTTTYAASGPAEPWIIPVDVKLPDIYHLSISVDAPAVNEVALLDEQGTVLRSVSGKDIDETCRFFLLPGSYSIRTTYQDSAADGIEGHFEYSLD